MRHYLFIAFPLFAFWLVLSGYFLTLLLVLGVLSAIAVAWLVYRMDQVDHEPSTLSLLSLGLGQLHYLFWLFGQVVVANIVVTRRIWDPSMPIKPAWERLDIQVSTPMEKTLYANSITLTPGTLTTDVKEDHFMIHSLSPEDIEGLRQGEMERRILKLGI